ncbi:hypothetical protein JXL19_05900 [bacterium]|nr:hypothetical protein [bacterium]
MKTYTNKFFMFAVVLLVSIGLCFTASAVFSQNNYSFYSSLLYPFGVTPQLTLTSQYMPYYTYMPYLSNPVTKNVIGQVVPTIVQPKPPQPEPIEAVPKVIQLNATEDGELTGEMIVKFDAEASPYPENYNYYFDGKNVYKDIKSYVTSLVREDEPKADAEAIYSFTISKWGIYKISNLVWAKDCGHDSFHVEIKRGDTRVPFPATNYSGGFYLVKTAHDRYEFNPNSQYNEWHWQDVCHWNVYYSPYERAVPCIYLLRPGSYKLIYRAREDLTRLAQIKIVMLNSIIAPVDDAEIEKFELDTMQKYFEDNHKTDSVNAEPQAIYNEEVGLGMMTNVDAYNN